jgi:hypothetical protein
VSSQLKIERHHRPKSGWGHLGNGRIVCLDGGKEVGHATYIYWDTPSQFAAALTDNDLPIEGPFFRRARRGHPIAGVDIDVSESHRKTQAFALLMRAIDELDMPVYARFGNERLGVIFRRRYSGGPEPSMQNLKPGTIVVGRPKGSKTEELLELGSSNTLCGMTVEDDWEIYRQVQGDPEMICDGCLYEDSKRD